MLFWIHCWMLVIQYSGTSLKGLSKLKTQYKKLRTVFQSQWYHANTFLPLKEENLYNSKNDPEMAGPKVSIIKRFHCISYRNIS